MPICPYCGRQLAEGERCYCQQQNAAPNGYQYQYPAGQQPPQKKKLSTGCLVALIVGIVLLAITLVVGGILAAILIPASMGYIKKSQLASANAEAKTYFNAACTALVDMDAQDLPVGGSYVISSAGDQNLPEDFAIEEFRYNFVKYLPEEERDCDYVLVMEHGTCMYAAVEKEAVIGTYPYPSQTAAPVDCSGELHSDGTFYDLLTVAYAYVSNGLPEAE